jgi:glycosyltransferase involved in cell wall biosynthesis
MKTIVQLFFGSHPVSLSGGAERVFVKLSNLAVEKNYKVIDICSDDNPNERPFSPLNEKVEFHNLGLGKIRAPLYRKIAREICRVLNIKTKNYVDAYRAKILAKYVNEILQNRDIYAILCYEIDAVFVANIINSKAPKIAMLHSSMGVSIQTFSKWKIKQMNQMDACQVLMPSFINEAKKYLVTKVACIPNIVPQVDCDISARQTKDKKIIINISRIEPQKQQDILVKAFAKIVHKFKNKWEIHLYGHEYDKKYKNSIEKFISDNHLSDVVLFKGTTKNVLEKLQNADIFAFPSAHEGFGLALAEAMSMRLPSIGFENAPGVNELIKDGENGFLCKDVDDFADKLSILMNNEDLRATMGLNARESIKEYSSDKVWAKWEKLFDEIYANT